MEFIEYPDRDMLILDLSNQIVDDLSDALHHKDRVTLSVPGGTTPGPIFDELSGVDMPWDRVNVCLNDERWVPETSDRSNTTLLRNRLLVSKAASATLLPMYADFATPEEGLPSLAPAFDAVLPIDVLLVGMGADMHTASLFPGADQLELALSSHAPSLLAMRAAGAPEPRITLSAPVLNGAIAKHVVIFGDEKRTALEAAQHLDPIQAPIKSILSGAKVHWAA